VSDAGIALNSEWLLVAVPPPEEHILAHLFVKVPRPGDSKVTRSVFKQAATSYCQSNQSKVEAIPLITLPKTQANLSACSSHLFLLMLNVKQGSCEYQLFKSFGPTRRGKLT